MRRLIALPLLALAACAASGGEPDPVPEGDYATQIEVPTPDYASLVAQAAAPGDAEIVREPTTQPPADAKAVGELWIARLEERGWVDGYGLGGKSDDDPVSSIDTRATAEDFDAWVAENGWEAPQHVRWRFMYPMARPRVSDAAEEGIRLWPASEQRTGLQLEAAAYGQIFLRDGCFFVRDVEGGSTGERTEKLAWFHTETGLDIDARGYYILVNRATGATGATMGRLGEDFMWAAPNPINPGGPDPADLIAACGDYEIVSVGNPEALERMYVTYPHLREPRVPPPPPTRPLPHDDPRPSDIH